MGASRPAGVSAPAERGGDVLQDRLDDVRVVVDAELVGDGQEQRVGLRDGLVLRQFFVAIVVADAPRWDLRLRRVSTALAIGLGRHARTGFQQRLEIAEDPRPAAAALGRIATARHHAGDHRGVRDIMSDGDRTHALPLHDFVSEA